MFSSVKSRIFLEKLSAGLSKLHSKCLKEQFEIFFRKCKTFINVFRSLAKRLRITGKISSESLSNLPSACPEEKFEEFFSTKKHKVTNFFVF